MRILLLLTVSLLFVLGPKPNQVNGQCYDLIHQYSQCKHLKMSKSNYSVYSYTFERFTPIGNTTNNELTDRYYRKLKGMSFEKAMNLFRKIYTETENCSSEFCQCVSLGVIDLYGKYSMYFRNESIFRHVVKIIGAFHKKFEPKLLSYSDLKYSLEFDPYSNQNLSSLAQFCIKFDYSKNRLRYYNNSVFTCGDVVSVTNFDYGCFWEAVVANKSIEWNNLTNSQLSKLMVCQMKSSVNTTIEEQRFCALSTWSTLFPIFAWNNNKDVTREIDSLIRQAETHKSQIQFVSSDLNTNSYANTIILRQMATFTHTTKYVTNGTFIYPCFNSTPLRIDCEWTLTNDNMLLWNWANLTFNFDDCSSMTISSNMSYSNEGPFDIIDGTMIKDEFGENWVEIRSRDVLSNEFYYIIDFKFNTTTVLSQNYLGIIVPKPLFDEADGLTVDGFPMLEIDLNSRKRRSVDNLDYISCLTACDRINLFGLESFMAANMIYNKCFNDCLHF